MRIGALHCDQPQHGMVKMAGHLKQSSERRHRARCKRIKIHCTGVMLNTAFTNGKVFDPNTRYQLPQADRLFTLAFRQSPVLLWKTDCHHHARKAGPRPYVEAVGSGDKRRYA